MTPEDLKYTDAHEWVGVAADGADAQADAQADEHTARVGVTDYAQSQLGDVVFVQLPDVGQRVEAGAPIGEIESTKSVSDLFAPVGGEVTAVNEALVDQPELVNSDPYGAGWIFEIRTEDPVEQSTQGLLDAAAYGSLTDQS
ncbi:MAG TPA: glycine cleavage system protein GcvH [Pseudonocardia sp.]|nr:glycine cleavage system protein GcvH [Pseudonocardia sp.]